MTEWVHVLSHDYGVVDSTAWAVWAWRRDRTENRLYLVEAFKWAGTVPDRYLAGLSIPRDEGIIGPHAAAISKRLCERYQPIAVVGDPGGGGKDFIDIARRLYGVPIRPAYKVDKIGQIEMFNTGLRTGEVVIVDGTCRDLLEEMELLQWKLSLAEVEIQGVIRHEERKVVDKRFEDHCCDAARYGLVEARRYMNPVSLKQRPPEHESASAAQTAEIRKKMFRKVANRRKKAWWETL